MKKLFALTAAAVALIATGCNKEAVSQDGPDAETPGVKVRRTLTAAAPVETRTALEGVDIIWQEGDAITVFGAETKEPYVFKIAGGAGTTTATFEGEMDADDASGSFYAIYPALSVQPESLADGKIEILDVLGVQTGVSGGFDPRSAVLTGTISGDKVTFRHGMAYFKLTVGSEGVTSIRLESSNVSLGGSPVYEADKGTSCAVNNASRSVKVKPASGTFEKGTTYYIPVPVDDTPDVDNNVYTLVLTYAFDGEGKNTASIAGMQKASLERGKVYNLGTPNVADAYPDLAQDVVAAERSRYPRGANYLDKQNGNYKWNYTTGLELKAMLDASEGNMDVYNYAYDWYDRMIDGNGVVTGYKMANYSTDHVCPGRTLFQLYDATGKFQKTIGALYKQLEGQPRTELEPGDDNPLGGGFWHKNQYPNQMWLDGLYMAQPFYAEYTKRYITDAEQRRKNYVDIAHHFTLVYDHTLDSKTGLLRHAWDSSHKMFWCDKTTGQSACSWGRAMGWYAMALVDVIEILTDVPEAQVQRNTLIDLLQKVYAALPYGRDKVTGMWFQVLDHPYEAGNYVEATASAMFVYSWLKGCRLGILEDVEGARAAYASLIKSFVIRESDGLVSLTDCCEVAGLGPDDNRDRDGSYEYYTDPNKTPVVKNDPKGIGPLIWAALEYNK